ncbi:hypothetical protein Enr13x_35110 [Stieleria neptunia]|uniref:Uncharacterized protein n=1 Tax=Stieleria neptunia TaxID=2527979 RepID=A0A518HS56_9BACT|nr:hypothetical protein Enr13x_35110 [Stieleria neptunia]
MVRGQTPMVRGQTPMVRGQTPMVRGQTPMVRGQTPMVTFVQSVSAWSQRKRLSNHSTCAAGELPRGDPR